MSELYDAVVIGGGPAGLTAAVYLARAKYRVVVLEKEKFGGQITITSEVVNYPGVFKTSGTELTETMRKQAESFGAEFLLAEALEIKADGDVKEVRTSRGTLRAFTVLIATGAHPRMVGFKGEADFRGHGVAYCATCDGEFFTGKEVFVVGGGFAAAEESVFLTKYATHVTILIRGNDFTCAAATAEEPKKNPKISIKYNTEVVSVSGDSALRKLVYRNNVTGEVTEYDSGNDTFGVFVFAGYEPETKLLEGIAELDRGYVVTDRSQKTTKDGIYAAGDVCIKPLRQVVTAVGDGALAATEMEKAAQAMQKKTGLRPEMPVTRMSSKKIEDEPKPAAKASSSLFTPDMVEQLNTVFSRMEDKVRLEVVTDERKVSEDLKGYISELAKLTDKLVVTYREDKNGLTPYVKVTGKGGDAFTFHGVPGGHEFTSFVLGLYNAAGPGQKVAEDVLADIPKLRPRHLDILVGLSCTMCPELVIAAERLSTLTENLTVDIYDINHFGALKDKYNVMSVPCFVVDQSKVSFGKKNARELLDILLK